MKIRIDTERCSGHGRCYDVAPSLFGDDERGYGQVKGDGTVTPETEEEARAAVMSCPERAVELLDE
ncbi:MAG TPA: ferredoxin [Acidimicrobiia bacterium]|nr:ferredoxin [Acidimicrobiia bacterium]